MPYSLFDVALSVTIQKLPLEAVPEQVISKNKYY